MPFVMLVGGFVCGVAWLVYGILLEDPNVYVRVLHVVGGLAKGGEGEGGNPSVTRLQFWILG